MGVIMKYVITKDKIILKVISSAKEDFAEKYNIAMLVEDAQGLKFYLDKEDLKGSKQADTIEDLCDEFVAWGEDQNKGKPLLVDKDQYYELIPIMIAALAKKINVWLKGAIWTDEGLTYIAKMNEKGELEVL